MPQLSDQVRRTLMRAYEGKKSIEARRVRDLASVDMCYNRKDYQFLCSVFARLNGDTTVVKCVGHTLAADEDTYPDW